MNEQVRLDIDTALPLREHWQKPFEPRAGSGGSRQKFCSDTCRKPHHKGDAGGDAENKPEPPTFKPAPIQDDANEVSWNDDDCVVIPHQAAIAVYFNPHGDVVIRQEGHYGPDEDPNGSLSRRKIWSR
jgi:hypothetical protein